MTLVELLVVISIIAFLAGALVVGAQRMRAQAQVNETAALMESIASGNELFYNDWRFYAPDSNIRQLGGSTWRYEVRPPIPDKWEVQEVDSTAPGMPGGRMPTAGIEYLMINLSLRYPYLDLESDRLSGPEREVLLGKLAPTRQTQYQTRCIIVDSWGRPVFYDCHRPEGQVYANGRVRYNLKAFDMFSLGPDGRTSSTDNNVDDDGDGKIDEPDEADKVGGAADDINNWRGTRRK